MAGRFDSRELEETLAALTQPAALAEAAVLAACLLAAWAIVRLWRGRSVPQDSIWFGRRIVDGVLFPTVALALAFGARAVLTGILKVAVLKLAIPILLSLLVIRWTVRVLGVSFPDSGWMRVLERSISWVAWAAVVLWVTGVLPVVLDEMDQIRWTAGGAEVSLRAVAEGALTAGMVLVFALWVSAAIESRLLRGTGSDLSMRKMAANLVRATLLFVGLLLALAAVGIDLTALSVLGGALGVGIGFGLQKIAANYVSGFVILAERSLRIGDVVRVDDFEGVVTDIRIRCTVIRALNGRESIVPNELLITQRVENASLADRRVAVSSQVQVAYGSDVAGLRRKLEVAIAQVPRVLADPAPSVQLANFGADGIDLGIGFWIGDPENGTGGVKSDVHLAVLAVLEAEGVEIPFPQRVVHQLPVPAPQDALPAAAVPQG